MTALRARVGAALAAAAILAAPATAAAWCRTAGCEQGVGAQCDPAEPGDCGVVLAWPTACLSYSLQDDGTATVGLERVRELVRLGFDQWTQADCGGGATPELVVKEVGPIACDERTFHTDGPNANAILFRDSDWPYSTRGVLALTTVTYGLETGAIRDADMEINTAEVAFSFDDASPTYDFQSILTHEAGHFLGLAHSTIEGATMVRDYEKGSTELRSISTDDTAGICAIYPAGDPGSCSPAPEGGLKDACEDVGTSPSDDGGGGCSASAGPPRSLSGAASALVALALAAGLARRRAGSPSRPAS